MVNTNQPSNGIFISHFHVMKWILLLFNLVVTDFASAQLFYSWVKIDDEIKQFRNIATTNDVINEYIDSIHNIHLRDISTRNSKIDTNHMRSVNVTDSINSYNLIKLFTKIGIPTFNYTNIQDDSLRFEIDSKRSLVFLHLIVENYISFFKFMELSVQKKIACMEAYTELTATYLFRITEFDNVEKCFCIPIPNFSNAVFQKYFFRTTMDFLQYYFKKVKKADKQFFLCRNPFQNLSTISFIEETLRINKQLMNNQLEYQTSLETLFINFMYNFQRLRKRMVGFNSQYIMVVHCADDRDHFILENFK